MSKILKNDEIIICVPYFFYKMMAPRAIAIMISNFIKVKLNADERLVRRWSSLPIDICNTVGAADTLSAFENPVSKKYFEEPHIIAQRKNFRRKPAPRLSGTQKERTKWLQDLSMPGVKDVGITPDEEARRTGVET